LTAHSAIDLMALAFHPVTPDRWRDLERLFGPRGANSGCWCLWWRLSRAEFDRSTADERKAGLKALVDAGRPPGILAYLADEPIAWVSLGPREDFSALERSRVLKRVDDLPAWSIVCFFVGKRYRRQGLMVRLLQGAVGYAAANGARIVEGYPVDPGTERIDGGSSGFMGLASAYRRAGFVEVARPNERRAIMRYYVGSATE
jgi:GNAT superfamily N-acetyltransferase